MPTNTHPFDQVQHTVAEHLSVDAEILVRGQSGQHGVRDGANAHLQSCAILDQVRCDQLSDLLLCLSAWLSLVLVHWGVVVNDVVEVRNVDEAI